MIGDRQRPLTVKAFQGFIRTLEKELQQSNLSTYMQDDVMEVLSLHALPRRPGEVAPGETWGKDESQRPRRRLSWLGVTNMPETMEELRELPSKLAEAGHFQGEPSRAYQLEIQKACDKALLAAEKTMEPERSR